jgi:hypothetical protein
LAQLSRPIVAGDPGGEAAKRYARKVQDQGERVDRQSQGTAEPEPSCFLEALDLEWWRIRDRMKRFLLRWHLSKYPKDLLRSWWDRDRCMPWSTSQLAFKAYSAGEKPGPLFKGPPHWPKLKLIAGGKHR